VLEVASVATRLPAQDLDRARRFYADKLGYEMHRLRTIDGIAEVAGNYPSYGGITAPGGLVVRTGRRGLGAEMT
jgi:catechol 2,3-dioxygenase-like lactoylglutathione lyase family enzyme